MNTFIDLFCGIGGFHQALKRLNYKCIFACDIDEQCRKVYQNNYNIIPESDITQINIKTLPDFDILCGGFPCQAFSNAGKKKSFNDGRGLLFNYIIDIAIVKQPKFMFLKNVKHIKKIDNGKVLRYILEKLSDIGYKVFMFELSPHHLGIP